MRKMIIAFLFLLMLSTVLFSQPITTEIQAVKTDYLQKSKKQQRAGWVLLSGGTALFITGFIIPEGEFVSSGNFWSDLFWGGHHKNDATKSAFWVTGTFSILGIIPLFLASGRNKKRP